jgi:hypothetical protein
VLQTFGSSNTDTGLFRVSRANAVLGTKMERAPALGPTAFRQHTGGAIFRRTENKSPLPLLIDCVGRANACGMETGKNYRCNDEDISHIRTAPVLPAGGG